MHRIVPDLIIDNYRAGRRRGSFQAVAMFIDLSGFSTITDVLIQDGQRGAEELSRLIFSVFDPLVRSVFEHGGRIIGFAGDGITAVYPADPDLGDSSRRALASAWSIQRRLDAMASLRTPYGSFPISAKIGVGCGEVSWGILESRSQDKATYYFRGKAVEEAAEAEHHAKAGEIVLARSVVELAPGIARTQSMPGFDRVTGLAEALPDPRPIAESEVDLGIARIFVPEAVLMRGLRGEFRQVVNLFLRMPPLSDQGLQDFMAALFDQQRSYGGLINHIDFGDKGCTMLLLWGAPVTYENDISRALNFAIDLKSKVEFPITAGITFHMAHAGYVGSPLFEDYTCYGWGVNLAARFMMSAEEGAIWLDERVVQRAEKTFALEFLGEQNFKGFAQKQKVHILKGRKAEPDSFYQGRLAGRDLELQQLAECLTPLTRAGSAGVTVVSGDPGIGKSRLVYEFRRSPALGDTKILWALCQTDQVLRQSFNPLRYWLIRYFDITPSSDDSERLQSFTTKMDALLSAIPDSAPRDELSQARSFLAALMDLHWTDSPYERMDAQSRYDNTLIALLALLKAESLRQPVILLIEDAHSLDEDSKVFLSRLKRTLTAGGSSPIAILLTSRSQGVEGLVEEGFADHHIDLGGLSAAAMISLSQDVLGKPAAPDLIRVMDERAEGNPFFAEQILRYLREELLLEVDESDHWGVKAGWESALLPADVTTMLVARLDQLAPAVKDAVQTAAVLGREFELAVLAGMLGGKVAMGKMVGEAERASIWSPLNAHRYFFRHSLLQEAAYSMQLHARRREQHAVALKAVEGVYANEISAHYPELAYHSEQAGLVDQARFYLRQGASAARDAYHNVEALDYYNRLLALVPEHEFAERFDLLLELVALHRRLGDRNMEAADLDLLGQLAGKLGDPASTARLCMMRAEYALNMGDFKQSALYAHQAVDLARAAADMEVTLGAYLILPAAYLRQGKFEESMSRAQEAFRLAQSIGREQEQGAALNLMGLTALEQKEPAAARGYFEKTLTIARASSDDALEAKSLNNLGNSAGFIEGDYAAARAYYEQAYAIVHRRGDRPAEGIALGNLGWTAGMQGDFTSARSYQDRALSIAREIGDPYQEAYTLINLSAAACNQGAVPDALRFAEQAGELALQIEDRSGQAWAFLNQGHAHLREGNFSRAREAYDLSAGIREELNQPGLATEPQAGLIQAALGVTDLQTAGRWTEVILGHLDGGGTLDGTEEPLRIYLACFRTLDAKRDPRARAVLQTAAKLLDAQVSKLRDDEARRMYVENVPWRLSVQRAWEAARSESA